ncbi:MAG: hypothetical protein FD177_2124 [Desulfovibrionaceae bacterium]|nr:MAG: hypothetical protein FD177_2124 [Desulfovibrionaceae bacterium]
MAESTTPTQPGTRKALVTGGTRGIGLAVARRLAADQVRVTITGTVVRQDLHIPEGMNVLAVDFTRPESFEAFADEVSSAGYDILVNNAGINAIAPFASVDMDDFDRIWQVNVRAAFRLCQSVLPGMVGKGWGRIVNVSSIFGKISKAWRASYSSSKFALDGMSAALAAEVASQGVLVNCVAPGFIDTELTRRVLGAEGMAELSRQIPMQRLGRAEEVAAFVAWLAGPENTYISGQNIAIDGGFTRV